MTVNFHKMNGAGNDFLLIDNRSGVLNLTPKDVVRFCDRHRGIGADGLILLVACTSGRAQWAWKFYNSDGSTGEMCGNGARCFARFVQRLTGQTSDLTFETEAGLITARFSGELVTVNLTEPKGMQLGARIPLSVGLTEVHVINTGVPHAVLFVPDADKAMIQPLGPEVRRHSHFSPRGTNVNFVQVLRPGAIRVRTFERGVEGETLACGTGVTASALITSQVHGFGSPIEVRVQGGDALRVSFDHAEGGFRDVWLTGPADFVFTGQVTP